MEDSVAQRVRRTRYLVTIGALIAVFVFTRFYELAITPANFYCDELGLYHLVEAFKWQGAFNRECLRHSVYSCIDALIFSLPQLVTGVETSIFWMRAVAACASGGVLILFYKLMRRYSPKGSSLLWTLLLACNGWFITFSRMAINNILVVLYAITVAALLSPAFEGSTRVRRIGARLLIGIVLSLATFSYFSGRILVLTTLAFLLLCVGAKVRRNGWKACAWTLVISASVYAAVSGAILLSYRKEGVNWLHMTMDRPQAVCWLCKAVQGSQRDFKWYWGSDSLSDALLLQARKIFRGYVLAQPVTSGGFENARYRPNDTALLNIPVGLLYTVGLLLLVLKAFKRDWANIPLHIKFFALLFVVHITIVAIPTDFSPNWARLVATIPFFFFVAAYGADRALLTFTPRASSFPIILVTLTIAFSSYEVVSNFRWMKQVDRSPQISYSQFECYRQWLIPYLSAQRAIALHEWPPYRDKLCPATQR